MSQVHSPVGSPMRAQELPLIHKSSTKYKNLRDAFRRNGHRISQVIEANVAQRRHDNDLINLASVQYYIGECFNSNRPDFPSHHEMLKEKKQTLFRKRKVLMPGAVSASEGEGGLSEQLRRLQQSFQDSSSGMSSFDREELRATIEEKIRSEIFYQDLFKQDFRIENLHHRLKDATKD